MSEPESFSLTGPRVRLRPLRLDDVPALLRQLEHGFTASDRRDEEENLRRMIAARLSLAGDGFWSLAIADGEDLVGDIQARAPRHGFPPGVCEIGITVRADLRGHGLGTEAVRLLTAYLHETGWPRVQASTAMTNEGMRRVLDRCGYGYEGVLLSYAPDDRGGRADYAMYASTTSH